MHGPDNSTEKQVIFIPFPNEIQLMIHVMQGGFFKNLTNVFT